MCVCDIVSAVGAGRSNVSRHLSVLSGAGILGSRKEGLMVFYHVRTPCILSIFSCVRQVLEDDVEQSRRTLGCLK
jgi:ArsR family transcriptional regulator